MGGNREREWKPVLEIDTMKAPFIHKRMPKPAVLRELFRMMLNLRVVHYVSDDQLEEYNPSLVMLGNVKVEKGFNIFVKKVTSDRKIKETLRLLRQDVISKAVFEADGYWQDVKFCFGSFCHNAGTKEMDEREKVLASDIKVGDGIHVIFDSGRWMNGSKLSWSVELSNGWENILGPGIGLSFRSNSRDSVINSLFEYLRDKKHDIDPRFHKEAEELIEILTNFKNSVWYFKI